MKPRRWRHKPVQDIPHRHMELSSIQFDNIFYSSIQNRAQGCFIDCIILANLSELFDKIPFEYIGKIKVIAA